MARNYKVSVKHYLNKTTVKPIIEDGVEKYPIYLYVTIMRRTIHKPCIIKKCYSDDEFENISNDIAAKYAIESEIERYEGIGKILIDDYINNRINKKLKYLTDRGFTSKDDFVNYFNSYCEYYSRDILTFLEYYIDNLLDIELTRKLKSYFDFSMYEENFVINTFTFLGYRLGSIENHLFFIKNLDGNLLKLCYIYSKCYHSEEGPLFFLLYQWRTDKNEVINSFIDITLKKGKIDELSGNFVVEINESDIRTILVPILDNILDVGNQLKKIND